jgi:hypothetical protein
MIYLLKTAIRCYNHISLRQQNRIKSTHVKHMQKYELNMLNDKHDETDELNSEHDETAQ